MASYGIACTQVRNYALPGRYIAYPISNSNYCVPNDGDVWMMEEGEVYLHIWLPPRLKCWSTNELFIECVCALSCLCWPEEGYLRRDVMMYRARDVLSLL